jgi:hypothetical protein
MSAFHPKQTFQRSMVGLRSVCCRASFVTVYPITYREGIMTGKPDRDPAEEQIIQVNAEVQKQVDAGKLNNKEAGEELDRLVRDSPSKE